MCVHERVVFMDSSRTSAGLYRVNLWMERILACKCLTLLLYSQTAGMGQFFVDIIRRKLTHDCVFKTQPRSCELYYTLRSYNIVFDILSENYQFYFIVA